MSCLCLLFLIPFGFMTGTIFLSPAWAQTVKTFKWQTDPCSQCPFLACPTVLEPQQQGKPCCTTSLLVWRGHTVELALTQCQHQKLQRQNPSKNRLFKDLNQQTPKSFCCACANWNFSKLDFQRNSIAGTKAVHLPKTFSRIKDLTQKFSGSSRHM